jgi:magnesium chelatase family protein
MPPFLFFDRVGNMSLAIVYSRALNGMSAPPVIVEVHLSGGLPCFTLVGLPETEVKESRERVRAAILTSGFDFPARRITVNLAPADFPKDSGRFDLPIALGILAASGQIPTEKLIDYELAGELSLTGELRPIKGAMAMTLAINRAGGSKRGFILPPENAKEAAKIASAKIFAAQDLRQVCGHFLSKEHQLPQTEPEHDLVSFTSYPDLVDVKGQIQARFALEVAAAGGHSMIMLGPPGTGKTMLAQRLPGILPPLHEEEALEVAAIFNLVQALNQIHFRERPFRSPHHTASAIALVGGGGDPKPGEISLAHHGVLFLDELPEFDRKVLEVLREPLESGHIVISRANRKAEFPAKFQLVAAMNPCPCGWLGHPIRSCRCTSEQVSRYRSKISGPLLDRIDLQIEVPAIRSELLSNTNIAESSHQVRERVIKARTIQHHRQGCSNAQLQGQTLETHCILNDESKQLLNQTANKLGWSARSFHRVMRVSRTLADLQAREQPSLTDVAQAIQFRRLFSETV